MQIIWKETSRRENVGLKCEYGREKEKNNLGLNMEMWAGQVERKCGTEM